MEKREQKKKNRITLLLLIMVVGVFFGIPKLNKFSQKQAEQQRIAAEEQEKLEEEIEKEQKKQEQQEKRKKFIEEMIKKDATLVEQGTDNIEPNSVQMLEYILAKASHDSQGLTPESEEFNTAFQFLVDNYPNYFNDNKMMEDVMYYGKLVEYVYEPRWENYNSSITSNFYLKYDAWEISYLKENELSRTLKQEELNKLFIAQCAADAAKGVYINLETPTSDLTQNELDVVASRLNLIYPDKTFLEE